MIPGWLDKTLKAGLTLHPIFDPFLVELCSGLSKEDAEALREERAAILEYEAGFSREEAEPMAGIHKTSSYVGAA